jgi:carbonic anhydrase
MTCISETSTSKWNYPLKDNVDKDLYVHSVPQSVKDDIALLQASPLVRKELLENVHGYVLDIKTGKLSKIDA